MTRARWQADKSIQATQDPCLERAAGSFLRDGQDDDEEQDEVFSAQMAVSINENLMRIGIPQLSGHEQIQLADMVECVAVVEMHRRSMDENGARFMLFCRQNALRRGRPNQMHLSWREINWAYHSGSQDLLVDFVSRQAHGEMLWEHARESGLFMWLSDMNAVVSNDLAPKRPPKAGLQVTLRRKASSRRLLGTCTPRVMPRTPWTAASFT